LSFPLLKGKMMATTKRSPGKKVSVKALCNSISGNIRVMGAIKGYVLSVASPVDADEMTLSYCFQKDKSALELIRKSKASVIICSDEMKFGEEDYRDKTLILVANPKLVLTRAMQTFFQDKAEFGIDPTAVIDKYARIHPEVCIGPNCYIGKCRIGKGTIIHGNVYVYSGVKIGERVVVHAGTVIGAPGMEFAKNESGQFEDMPHISSVVIEDDVWIGSNVSIMRGVFSDTVIGQGTKLGHLCSIGHQTVVGQHCLIITRSVIGGSCRIGDHARISMAACIRDGISIGNNAIIGMGSLVTKSIDDGMLAYGVPAKVIKKVE